MASRRHRTQTTMSVHSRPASRASTTSATSQQNDSSTFVSRDGRSVSGVELETVALLQFNASIARPQQVQPYDMHQQQHEVHHSQAHSMYNATDGSNYFAHDPALIAPDMSFRQPQHHHVRVGSASVQSGAEMGDDKRRKGSAVTATNDKELREMLSKNQGRALREVAQDVIAKERTPMAEKTKQLFAMLW